MDLISNYPKWLFRIKPDIGSEYDIYHSFQEIGIGYLGYHLNIRKMTISIDIPVTTIMSKNIISVDVKDGLAKAEHLFKKHKIRHMPVTHHDKIVGMLSINDLLRLSFADGAYREEGNIESEIYEMFTINQVMVRKPETVSSKTTVREVTSLLAKRKYHALPVVDEGLVVGMVTTTDLLKYYLSMF